MKKLLKETSCPATVLGAQRFILDMRIVKPRNISFFDLPLELRWMVYRNLTDDNSKLRLVSKQFWKELCDENGKVAIHIIDMNNFIADYFRDRVVLLEPETMITSDWLYNQHGSLSHQRAIPLYTPPIDIEYAQHVRYLHLTNFCLLADTYFRLRNGKIPCAAPSSGYGVTHLRYAFPNLLTVSCGCAEADVEWSSYAENDSCVNNRISLKNVHASALIIPRMTGILLLLHGWQQMALKARILPDKGMGSRSFAYQMAATKRLTHLRELAGQPATSQREVFEKQLQDELTKALVHSPAYIGTEDNPFPIGFCEKRWPTAKCIINEVIDKKLKAVQFLRRKNRSFYEMRNVDGWKWVFVKDKIQKSRSKKALLTSSRKKIELQRL
jgi:hypothetical protein